MPSTSPGSAAAPLPPSHFAQILPGAPAESLQAFTTFVFRFKRYVAYISGSQLNILSSSNTLTQIITFKHDLAAIAADNETGKLLVAGTKDVWVLEPHTEGWTKVWWVRTLSLQREDEGDQAQWLSWGEDGEALVAGDRVLTLFSTLPSSRTSSPGSNGMDEETAVETRALWSKSVASPIRQAEFSPSATLIASRGRYDRLVKIWRRLSFEEGLFDHMYLPHPGAVTHLQWRPMGEDFEDGRSSSGVGGRPDEESEVLYTVASDGILRIWRTVGLHDLEILTLHTTVDLVAAIPQSPSLTVKGQVDPATAPRYVVVLPSEQFCAAVNSVIGISQEKTNHSKELLKEMISKEPDVIIAFDGQGRMSAWGIQSIGHKRRPDTPTITQAYHIAHAEALQLRLSNETAAVCATWLQDNKLHLLTHSLINSGNITWWQADVETVFSPSSIASDRFTASSLWCGHDRDITQMQQSGDCIWSRSLNEVVKWRRSSSRKLEPQIQFRVAPNTLAVTTINSGQLVLTVSPGTFELWDQNGQSKARGSCRVDTGGQLHTAASDETTISGVFVPYDTREITRWTVQLIQSRNTDECKLDLQTFPFSLQETYADVTHAVLVSMPFDIAQVCLVSTTKAGQVQCTLVPEVTSNSSELEPFAVFETGLSDCALFAADAEFAALTSTDRKELIIVDLTDGFVEYRQHSMVAMNRLACYTPTSRHNFLAIARETSIEVLAQGRYEYNGLQVPTWLCVKTVSIARFGLEISAFTWISDGSLAAAACNALFVTKADVQYKELKLETREAIDAEPEEDRAMDLLRLSRRLKDPLPVWHPSVLSQLVRHGHYGLATALLKLLARKIKFWSAGDELSPDLGERVDRLLNQRELGTSLDDDTISDLEEQLEEKRMPRTSRTEQQRLKHIIVTLVYLRDHVKGLDDNALRYVFDWKMQLLHAVENQDAQADGSAQSKSSASQVQYVPEMQWREICFAYHSTTQQPLLDILVLHYDNKLTWAIARRLGIMAWLSEREALEQVFEQLGQTAYRSEQPPDPVDASIYYLALQRKQTLLALWRIATWHKEQRTTMNFLKRDFSHSDARTAAKKNAYALMGKRRFHYAAAFFLLAQDAASATSLLAGQCEDTQFAIAVARLYCGDGSAVLRKLLEDRIYSQAQKIRDRWLMSWCCSVMLEKDLACEALVAPLEGVNSWQQDDPLTLLLYNQLRKQPSEHEYDALLRAARVLRRMGLWLLALELVSRWEFKEVQHTRKTAHAAGGTGLANGIHNETKSILDEYASPAPPPPPVKEPPSMLDGFTQPEPVAPAPAGDKAAREAKAAELLARLKAKKDSASALPGREKKTEPTQFKEPDPNSLLDSFGF